MDIIKAFEETNTREPKKRDYFYVTNLGSCPRQVIYNMEGREAEPYTVGELSRFQSGTFTQRNWEYAWNRKGILLAKEFYIPALWGKPFFHGRVDDLLYNLSFNEEFLLNCNVKGDAKFLKSIKPTDIILLEFKTARSNAFSYPNKIAKLSHKLQTWAYQIHLEEFFPSLTIKEHAFLFYVDRDGTNKPILHILERPDKDLLRIEATKLIQAYRNFKEKDILPPALSRNLKKVKIGGLSKVKLVSNWKCNYCKYRRICELPEYKSKDNVIGTVKGKSFVPNKNYDEFKMKDFINDDEIKSLIQKEEK